MSDVHTTRVEALLDVRRSLLVTKPTGRGLCGHQGTGAMPLAAAMPVKVEVSVYHRGLGERLVVRRGMPAARHTRPAWERARRHAAVSGV